MLLLYWCMQKFSGFFFFFFFFFIDNLVNIFFSFSGYFLGNSSVEGFWQTPQCNIIICILFVHIFVKSNPMKKNWNGHKNVNCSRTPSKLDSGVDVFSIMIIVVGNGICNLSSNPGKVCVSLCVFLKSISANSSVFSCYV